MQNNIFEAHLLSNKPLPFIFHFDTIKKDKLSSTGTNWHPNIELLYFVNGAGTVICEGSKYNVEKNDIFIVNSNMVHAITSSAIIQYHCLIIDSAFCDANNIDTENTTFIPLIKDSCATELFDDVIKEYENNSIYKNAGIKSAVLRLMVYLARNYTASVAAFAKAGTNKTENIKIAIGYIKSHYNEKLSLDEISSQVGLSKYYFLREFKKSTGYTPISYINKIRCENAKKMLLSGSCSIEEISEKIGFDNFSYFSKTFRKSEGCSPSEYMKRHRK